MDEKNSRPLTIDDGECRIDDGGSTNGHGE